jgi:hypothetical protein
MRLGGHCPAIVMERLLFLAKVDRGLEQAESGQTISHAQVKDQSMNNSGLTLNRSDSFRR